MSIASKLLGTAAVVTLMVASAAAPVSADRGPSPSDCAVSGTCCFLARPAVAAWKPTAIVVDFERVTVGDVGLSRTQVRWALRRQAAPIEACFQRDSTIDVGFVLSPAGAAQRPTAHAKDPELATCVAGALRRIVFPVTEASALTEVTLTIRGRRAIR